MNAKVLEMAETVEIENSNMINASTEKSQLIKENTAVKLLKVYKKEYKVVKILNLSIKRIIDIIGSIVGIALLIPVTIIVAILNFINKDDGPLFYSHTRIGKDGKLFKMYKFRTMVIDADERLERMLNENEEIKKEWEENRKLKKDPRITKIGDFLRKTSLDEFPQFFNVLKGEMSLVRSTSSCRRRN